MNHYHLRLLLFFSFFILCYCQIYEPYITQPQLISVIPVNSTALTVTWQFANSSIDESDLIEIYIIFYEYYYGYEQVYASTNYTFTSTNKTITNLTMNFQLVNAYYYVCFSSNSTVTNASVSLAILNQCILTRTCLRSNTACPGPSSVLVTSTSISSNSFLISFLWPNDLPYSSTSFSVQLINNGQIGTALSLTQNFSYTNRLYQFTSLQSNTTYTVNTSFTYTILDSITTNITILTVTTSCSWKLVYPSDLFFFSMILFLKIKFYWIDS
jgi:hypothetical protein